MILDHRAGPLKKTDLRYRYAPNLHGTDDLLNWREPDSSDLRRHDWYEVLYFVNKFANTNGLGSVGVARLAEKLINERVPAHLRSHDEIRNWLLQNWKFYAQGNTASESGSPNSTTRLRPPSLAR